MMANILEQAKAIRAAMDAAGAVLEDGKAVECMALYRPWVAADVYEVGELRRYGRELYRCLTGHQGQEDWTPDVSPSLWVRVDDPAEEWPAWRQPQGSTDAYPEGAKVEHDGKRWVSLTDANVWEPGAAGSETLWREVVPTEMPAADETV